MRAALALALLLAVPARAQDAERGRLLYQTHCLGCHYERIHKRDASRSRIVTLAGLQVEVAERGVLTGRPFAREDLDDITEYLNRSYYRLQK
ncbi:MAG: cytochrome c [Burkholderiales bacterium]